MYINYISLGILFPDIRTLQFKNISYKGMDLRNEFNYKIFIV